MSYQFKEVRENVISVLNHLLGDTAHLMKGGQALALHLREASAQNEARFSKDIDFSLASAFPFSRDDFCSKFKAYYNKTFTGVLAVRDITADKSPRDPTAYFGVRVQINFGERHSGGSIGHKIYFSDIGSQAVTIDFSCNELVPGMAIISLGGVQTACVSLIVAEKLRALCSYPHKPDLNPNPRPKDFYDLFVIYTVLFNRHPAGEQLLEIKSLIEECFAIREMPLALLQRLEDPDVREFTPEITSNKFLIHLSWILGSNELLLPRSIVIHSNFST